VLDHLLDIELFDVRLNLRTAHLSQVHQVLDLERIEAGVISNFVKVLLDIGRQLNNATEVAVEDLCIVSDDTK